MRHALGQLVGMRQEKGEVEGTRRIQNLGRLFQIRSFAGIGSPLSARGEVKEQLRGTRGLSHRVVLPIRTEVLGPSSVLRFSLVVKLFHSSGRTVLPSRLPAQFHTSQYP